MWNDQLCELHKTLYNYNTKGFHESKLAKGVQLRQFQAIFINAFQNYGL